MAYASAEELARLLKVDATARATDLDRVLDAATLEIESEIGQSFGMSDDPEIIALLREVNLERAVEHWQQQFSPFGILGLGAESGAVWTARDSWDRHAHKLAPLKISWGLA